MSGIQEMRLDRAQGEEAPQQAPPQRPAAAPRRARVQTFTSLKSKDFRLLWVGNIFDHMALWLQMITLSWLVWDLTESALLSRDRRGAEGIPHTDHWGRGPVWSPTGWTGVRWSLSFSSSWPGWP